MRNLLSHGAIDLVADAREDCKGGLCDCAGNGFQVECSKISSRTSAAAEQDHVYRQFLSCAQGTQNRSFCLGSLHPCIKFKDVKPESRFLELAKNICVRRATEASNQRDAGG
jgi:hypothetical protein